MPLGFLARLIHASKMKATPFLNTAGGVPVSVDGWFMTVNSFYAAFQERPIDRLDDPGEEKIYASRLRDGWGLRDRDGFLLAATQMIHFGHRRVLLRAQKKRPDLPQLPLIAYDAVTFFYLCRGARVLHWISEEEQRVFLLHGAHLLQKSYGSWAEMFEAYRVGYALNSLSNREENRRTRAHLKTVAATIDLLVHAPQSPVQAVPWDLVLPPLPAVDAFERASRRFVSPRLCWDDETFPLSGRTAWFYSVAAIYRVFWGIPVDAIVDSALNQTVMSSFPNEWGITNSDELSAMLDRLANGHHRSRIEALQRTMNESRPLDLRAWDLVRLFQLATSSISAGLMEREVAHARMAAAGAELQTTYESWDALAEAFVQGRDYWQRMRGTPLDDLERIDLDGSIRQAIHLLRTDVRSPWKRVDWRTPLTALHVVE